MNEFGLKPHFSLALSSGNRQSEEEIKNSFFNSSVNRNFQQKNRISLKRKREETDEIDRADSSDQKAEKIFVELSPEHEVKKSKKKRRESVSELAERKEAPCCDELPDEMLGHIFSYLAYNKEDRTNLSLTSKRFYRVLTSRNTPFFLRALTRKIRLLDFTTLQEIQSRPLGKELLSSVAVKITRFDRALKRAELDILSKKFPNLADLKICATADADLKNLPRGLKKLTLSRPSDKDKDPDQFLSLLLSGPKHYQVTDKSLEGLLELKSLESLSLSDCSLLTDKGIESLSNLKQLKSLNLSGCSLLTDKSLESLSDLKNLESLNLKGCTKMTEKGIESIAELKNLVELNVLYCGSLERAAIDELKKQLPSCRIEGVKREALGARRRLQF